MIENLWNDSTKFFCQLRIALLEKIGSFYRNAFNAFNFDTPRYWIYLTIAVGQPGIYAIERVDSMNKELKQGLGQGLEQTVVEFEIVKENPYCHIYIASDCPCIIYHLIFQTI